MAASLTELSLGPLAELLGFHLARASVTTDRSFALHIGEPFALRKVEFSLLMLILTNGPQPPKHLARALMLTAPNLTLQLDRLVGRGLVERAPNPADGRSQHIVLTAKGSRLARKAARATPLIVAELANRLTPDEQHLLIDLLRKTHRAPTRQSAAGRPSSTAAATREAGAPPAEVPAGLKTQ